MVQMKWGRMCFNLADGNYSSLELYRTLGITPIHLHLYVGGYYKKTILESTIDLKSVTL